MVMGPKQACTLAVDVQAADSCPLQAHIKQLDVVERAYSAQQEDTHSAASDCLHMMWQLNQDFIDCWLQRPKVFAAIGDSLHMHNATFSRSELCAAHHRELVRLYAQYICCL